MYHLERRGYVLNHSSFGCRLQDFREPRALLWRLQRRRTWENEIKGRYRGIKIFFPGTVTVERWICIPCMLYNILLFNGTNHRKLALLICSLFERQRPDGICTSSHSVQLLFPSNIISPIRSMPSPYPNPPICTSFSSRLASILSFISCRFPSLIAWIK